MLDFLKEFRRKQIIKQMMHGEREKKIATYDDIANIGIVFTVGDESDWNLLFHFAQLMEQQGKCVTMIGFQPDRLTINYIITHSKTIICREKDDFDFWGIPKNNVAEPFLEQHFDILIDTTDQTNFFGRYIALKADADLKVTYTDQVEQTQNDNIFDMMIQGEGIIDLRHYLNNVVLYLKMIKK